MQGVNCLQDLKSKLSLAGFEVLASQGWYVDTVHGKWTMAFGAVYLNSLPIKDIKDAVIPKKKVVKQVVKKAVKKVKSKTKKKKK